MRKKMHIHYVKRLKAICRTELTTRNKITAINQRAVPVVTYGFGIIDWAQREINESLRPTTVSLAQYLLSNPDSLMKIVA